MGATTITAPATALQPSGVAIIRVSGELVRSVLEQIFFAKKHPLKNAQVLCFGKLVVPASKEILDRCLAVFMPGPDSFTGEDVCEFHLHGSPLLVKTTLQLLYQLGVKPAAPGEFSERSFLAGKLDLTQAEAIADLINSSSQAALKLAQDQLGGRLKNVVTLLGEPLKDSLAELEAHIDFPEEDIQPITLELLKNRLIDSLQQLDSLLSSYNYGRLVKDGLKVLIYGCPNVGKSSLLNYFLREERAIVTPISGTTRDTLEEQVELGGYKFIFCDTAGITETKDYVEQLGIARAQDKIKWADLILFVVTPETTEVEYQSLLKDLQIVSVPVWLVVNKIDLSTSGVRPILDAAKFKVSALTGAKLDLLEEALVGHIKQSNQLAETNSAILTNERHRLCLSAARTALSNAITAMNNVQPLEIISAELRLTISALSELIGELSTEDLLGRIFSKFCIGK